MVKTILFTRCRNQSSISFDLASCMFSKLEKSIVMIMISGYGATFVRWPRDLVIRVSLKVLSLSEFATSFWRPKLFHILLTKARQTHVFRSIWVYRSPLGSIPRAIDRKLLYYSDEKGTIKFSFEINLRWKTHMKAGQWNSYLQDKLNLTNSERYTESLEEPHRASL